MAMMLLYLSNFNGNDSSTIAGFYQARKMATNQDTACACVILCWRDTCPIYRPDTGYHIAFFNSFA
jgi:hypothetical protein